MTLLTHMLGGATTVAVMDVALTNYSPSKLTYLIAAIVAILPDLDYSRSFIGRIFYPISRYIETHSHHRGMTHSFFAALLVAGIGGYIASLYLAESHLRWAVIIGFAYCSHFILDWFTKEGAQSYWPAKIWCVIPKRRSWRIKTGSAGEFLYVLILLVLFSVSFSPTREQITVWFRSSFTEIKDTQIERIEINRQKASHGYSRDELKELLITEIISLKEYNQMINELDKIDLHEKETREKFGIKHK